MFVLAFSCAVVTFNPFCRRAISFAAARTGKDGTDRVLNRDNQCTVHRNPHDDQPGTERLANGFGISYGLQELGSQRERTLFSSSAVGFSYASTVTLGVRAFRTCRNAGLGSLLAGWCRGMQSARSLGRPCRGRHCSSPLPQ